MRLRVASVERSPVPGKHMVTLYSPLPLHFNTRGHAHVSRQLLLVPDEARRPLLDESLGAAADASVQPPGPLKPTTAQGGVKGSCMKGSGNRVLIHMKTCRKPVLRDPVLMVVGKDKY